MIFQLARGYAELDGEPEDIDEFLPFVTDKMCAENAIGCAIHDDLGSGDGLAVRLG